MYFNVVPGRTHPIDLIRPQQDNPVAIAHFDHARRLKITLEATDDFHVNVMAEEASTGNMTYRVMVARFQ